MLDEYDLHCLCTSIIFAGLISGSAREDLSEEGMLTQAEGVADAIVNAAMEARAEEEEYGEGVGEVDP